jgi:hypothetical protein
MEGFVRVEERRGLNFDKHLVDLRIEEFQRCSNVDIVSIGKVNIGKKMKRLHMCGEIERDRYPRSIEIYGDYCMEHTGLKEFLI